MKQDWLIYNKILLNIPFYFFIWMIEKRTFVRPTCGWQDNINIHLEETERKVVDWIHLVQDGGK